MEDIGQLRYYLAPIEVEDGAADMSGQSCTAARLITKRDYTHDDQALTDGFCEGFYSDGNLTPPMEEKTHGGRNSSPGEPGELNFLNHLATKYKSVMTLLTWDVCNIPHRGVITNTN